MNLIEQQRSILCGKRPLPYHETAFTPNSQPACSTIGLESSYEHRVRAVNELEVSERRSGNLQDYQAYSGQAISRTIKEVPVYDTHMISLDPYNFPTGAELLAKPKESGCDLHPSKSEVTCHNNYEGKNFLQGSFSSQSSVTSIKTENWGNTSDQLGFDSAVGESCREASPTSFTRSLTSESIANSFVIGSGPSRPFTVNSGRDRMASYLSGSNVQADAMQTLYLMNPGYTGYGDSSNTGNMVLVSPNTTSMGQGNLLGNPSQQQQQQQQQQQYIGFSLPPALAQSSLSQQSHIDAMSNSNIGHQNASSNIFTSRVSNHGYSWNGGNELSFLPSSDVAEDNHPLAARFNSVNSGQHSTSDMSHYGVRNLSQSPLQEQVPLIPNDVALGLNMENLQASTGAGQILSLSLSPQEPSLIQLQSFPIQHSESGVSNCPGFSNAGIDNSLKGDRMPNKCNNGSLSSYKASPRESMLGTGFQIQLNGAGSNRQVNMLSSAPTMEIYGSKYLKAAQQLLNEVVSVGRGVKISTSKHTQLQSWMVPSTTSDCLFAKGRNIADTNGKDGAPVASWTSAKEGGPTVASLPTSTASVPEHTENVIELTPAEKQELQLKKAKLMAMLDEVDRRYKQYYHQMQIVVASFESAAGLGAARTYTTLALQTISKHFRCLKDAISGQIRDTNRALGEEDNSGQGRGEISRLRFVDQQLRQQRALQQLGMMQQHAWRPQRGLPERSVSVLRAWLFEHFLHPYPKDSDKILLARQTGLTRSQVSNWFINARVRLWKPMVEEMYTEEVRDGGDAEGPDKPAQGEGENVSRGGNMMDGAGNNEMKQVVKDTKAFDGNSEGFLVPKNASDHAPDMLQSRNLTGSSPESFLVSEKELSRQGVKKAKNGVQDSASLLSPNSSTGVDFKADEVHGEEVLEHDMKIRIEDTPREKYSIPHSGLVQAADHQNVGGYGSFQVSGLQRYSQEGLAAMYAANSGVSLTLGLQHSESSPLSGAQQHYVQGHGHLPTGRRQESGGSQANYYNVNENRAGHTNSYEAMNIQNQKRFATHILHHDFTA